MYIRHYDHLWLRFRGTGLLLGCVATILVQGCRRRRHATITDQFRVTQRADAMEVPWWRNISRGLDLRPMSSDEIQLVEIRSELGPSAGEYASTKNIQLVS